MSCWMQCSRNLDLPTPVPPQTYRWRSRASGGNLTGRLLPTMPPMSSGLPGIAILLSCPIYTRKAENLRICVKILPSGRTIPIVDTCAGISIQASPMPTITAKYRVRLSQKERCGLKRLMNEVASIAMRATHARILMLADESRGGKHWDDPKIAEALMLA